MSREITPEARDDMIEQAAQYIVSMDLEDLAIVALEGTAPFGDVVGELGVMMAYPFALTFFNRFGADFVQMLGFNYQENAGALKHRIEELQAEKKKEELRRKELQRELGKDEGMFSGLVSWFKNLFGIK